MHKKKHSGEPGEEPGPPPPLFWDKKEEEKPGGQVKLNWAASGSATETTNQSINQSIKKINIKSL